MASNPPARPTRSRVAAHRAGLRARAAAGPDLGARHARPGFAAEARRQARLVDAPPGFDDTMEFLERISVFDDDEPRAPG